MEMSAAAQPISHFWEDHADGVAGVPECVGRNSRNERPALKSGDIPDNSTEPGCVRHAAIS
jgi:hypothetical protein